MSQEMRRWFVVTPEFDYTDIIVDGQGPTYPVRDVIEIEAETARDAIALGVKEMLKQGHDYRWCRDARTDGVSPYTGVEAFPAQESE